jgi:type I restriction-modification system DNA methylase subunit
VQLVVDMLDLLPIDRVYDPACGDGQLLLACSNDMARRVPSHQLHLHGNVADAGQAALAGMHMLAHGLRLFVLEQTDALGTPLVHKVPDPSAGPLPCADVVLTRLPDAPQDWGAAAAVAATDTCRFPLGPPKDSRIALIWHGLAHLKDDKSRMGVILSLKVLDSAEGLALRCHLVQHYHLEAVIELPGTRCTGSALSLLLLRRENSLRTVAFIARTPYSAKQIPTFEQKGEAYDVDTVLRAYHAYLASCGLQHAPFLHLIDYHTLAKHDCQFYLAAYDRWLCGE